MEYQAKELFAKHGVPATLGKVVENADDAAAAAEELGGKVVVKAGKSLTADAVDALKMANATGDRATVHAAMSVGSNTDGDHPTHPNTQTMEVAMRMALQDANLSPDAIGYVNFYILTTVVALPGVLLFWFMIRSGLADLSIGTAGVWGFFAGLHLGYTTLAGAVAKSAMSAIVIPSAARDLGSSSSDRRANVIERND